MPTPAELHLEYSSFPNGRHVQEVCKMGHGAKTCRYLTRRSSQGELVFSCAKATVLREWLDQSVKSGKSAARGDNCAGTLGFIAEHQPNLVGNTLISTASSDMTETEDRGVFDVLTIEDGKISIGGILSAPVEDVRVNIDRGGIVFSYVKPSEQLGLMTMREKVLWEKPTESENTGDKK